MAKGAYVEDGWVDESAASSSGPGFFGTLFGGGKSASASKMAQQDALNRELDVIEFVDGTKGSLTDAARGGTAVPFGGLNPAQVAAYDVDGQKEDEVKKPWGGYAPMPESAVEFFKECVLLLQNVFSYYRMCSLTTECVLLLQNVFSYYRYAPMPESAVEFFIKYPEKAPNKSLPAGWYMAVDEASGQEYYYKEDGTTTWERPSQ